MELILLYFWLKLNVISGLFIVSSILCIIVAIILYISVLSNNENVKNFPSLYPHAKVKSYRSLPLKRFIIPGVLLMITGVLLPSKTDTAILVAGHYALKATETPEAYKIMSVLRKKANDLLDAELEKKVDTK